MATPPVASAPSPAPSALGCTCARLRRLTRRITALYDRELAPTGLRVTQYSLLANLRRRSGAEGDAGVPVSALADALDMDRTTLTRNLRPLLDQGWVALAPDAADARVRRARITPHGQAVFDGAVPHWRAAQAFVNRTLGEADVAALHTWLDRVTPAFRAEPATLED